MNTQEKIDFEQMRRDVDEIKGAMLMIAEAIGDLKTQVEESYVPETLFRGVPISKLSPDEKAKFMDETLGIKPVRRPGRNPFES